MNILLPLSKSISNRVLIIEALRKGDLTRLELAKCDDSDVMLKALTSTSSTIDIGAAGTSMRFLTAFYALKQGNIVITGTERMQQRPIGLLVDSLISLGADIKYQNKEGYPPLIINGGGLTGGKISISGSTSSQFISALMMIAPYLTGGLEIELTGDIVSRSYIQLTIDIMTHYGVEVVFNSNIILVKEGEYTGDSLVVEADWSAASYAYALVALGGANELYLPKLFKCSSQGDSAIVNLFERIGVKTVFDAKGAKLIKTDDVVAHFEYDFTNQPDVAQTFAVVCCMLNIPYLFTGLETLSIKETDRITAMITELGKCGYLIMNPNHGQLSWTGERCEVVGTPSIATYHDHRMAMSMAFISLERKIVVEHPEVVTKSFPDFWQCFPLLLAK